jgi:FG-GAP repeat
MKNNYNILQLNKGKLMKNLPSKIMLLSVSTVTLPILQSLPGVASNLDEIDLTNLVSEQGFYINGAAAYDLSGGAVSFAGDINNDGMNDIIIGASYASPYGRSKAGSSYIVYGRIGGYDSPFDLASLNSIQGFRIDGAAAEDLFGSSVSSAGDINNDGIDDIIIGASYADPYGRSRAGSSYVIYGRIGGYGSPLDLANLNSTQGFRIDGATAEDYTGNSVSAAGDINNDGINDIIVGASRATPLYFPYSRVYAGSSYVIYGKTGGYPTPIDLANLNNIQWFRINGAMAGDASGSSVSSAGDINNDGIDDLIIGAPGSCSGAGSSYVIYGKTGGYSTSVDLASLNNTQGFRINGAMAGDASGISVSSAGDINNDGIKDIIIGAFGASPFGLRNAGSIFIIYGKAGGYNSSLDLASLSSTQGFYVNGAAAGDYTGNSVSAAGDINNDGISDVIIGAYSASPNGNAIAGSTYVVYGKVGGYSSPLNLASLNDTQGFRINGTAPNDHSGISVSFAGDMNNDGIDDAIIGASYVSISGRLNAGSSYVIYGKASPSPSPSLSPSMSVSPSPSASSSSSPSMSVSPSPSPSPSLSPSVSVSPSPSASSSSSPSMSVTPSPSISPSPSSSPKHDSSSASSHGVPWYSPAQWLNFLVEWWSPQEDIDTSLPYIADLLDVKSKCQQLINQASEISSDRWYQFSLEDLVEDINFTLKNAQNIQKGTIRDIKKRLQGIEKDFLLEDKPQPISLLVDQVQELQLNNAGIALNLSVPLLAYQVSLPHALTN